ncbi:hypothetical protein ALI22I_23890 [Saccharothrix sp. ALI-22-I]|uniref:RIP homotypic interaction motif-containing protein n=1 Tax=Saccharothrix sp. ALI-22-I TaxID=1933778 RepID=UPI00097CC060|nr:RIP homotypic interaction motif-containing protein [Saccharothrix sp. ALI-22-I]ONI86675.1 hypothetical protein ALI22I_23890 [Saccharothrix sp. ALI-22-I]
MVGDVLDVVVAGLTAGAAAGVKDTASLAVKDAYAGPVGGLRRRSGPAVAKELHDAAHDDSALDREQRVREQLLRALDGASTTPDDGLVIAARDVLDRLGPAGKYTVDAREAQGVQIGEHNSMTLNPGPRPGR